MRLLAIRGAGLLSLKEPFEINLDAEPLRSAGLFLVVGPTGAGKSALLDAVALALYGRAPRLERRSADARSRVLDAKKGRAPRATDPRGLVHQGTRLAFAEVDVETSKGEVLRARWEVRIRPRAGDLGEPTQSLLLLPSNTPIGAKLTEVRSEIVQRLGLDFDQFCRTVLLPQGDFAAFLDGTENERAAVLERLTGTQAFARLSMLVHERSAALEKELTILDAEGRVLPLLEPAVRQELVEQLGAARTQALRDEAAARIKAEERVRVHAAEAAAKEFALAEAAVAELEGQRTLWETQRRDIEIATRVDPVRRAQADAERASLQAQVARDAYENARLELAALEAAVVDLDVILRLGQRELPRWDELCAVDEANALARRELISEAERLERDIKDLVSVRQSLMQRVDSSTAEVVRLETAMELGAEAVREAQARISDASALADQLLALAGQSSVTKGSGLDLLSARVERLATLERSTEQVALELHELKVREQGLDARLALLQAELASIPRTTLEPDGALDVDREGFVEAKQAFVARQQALAGLREAQNECDLASGRVDALMLEQGALRAKYSELEPQERLAEEQLAKTEREVVLAADALRQVEKAHALTIHRQDLRDGEPCPLCGALEHPATLGALGDALDALLEAAKLRVEHARSLSSAEREALDGVRTARLRLLERLEHVTKELEGRRNELENRRARLSDGIASAPLVAGVRVPADPTSFVASLEEEVRVDAARLADLGRSIDARLLEQREREQRVRDEEQRHADLQLRLRAELEAKAELRGRVAELERQAAAVQSGLAEADVDSLDVALRRGGFVDAQAQPRAIDVSRRVALFMRAANADRETHAREGAALDALKRQLESTRRRVEQDSAALAVHDKKAEADEARSSELRAQTVQLMPSAEAAEAVEYARAKRTEFHNAAREASERKASILRAKQRQETEALRFREAESQRAEQVERARLMLEALTPAEQAILNATGLEAHRFSAVELQRLSAELRSYDESVATKRALLADRERRLREALDAAQGLQSVEELGLAEGLARTRWQESVAMAARLEAQLAEDAKRLVSADAHGQTRDALVQKLRVHKQASMLLGSADGRRLRNFVQSLTLDLLVARANEQLRRLAPRYTLARSPEEFLSVWVLDDVFESDGGFRRSTTSLSGGERFLVSLALALALGDLTGDERDVGTLLIDEGFGTLDERSIDDVLLALEVVRQSGRQIGLVSHVPRLLERIEVQVEVKPNGKGASDVEVIIR